MSTRCQASSAGLTEHSLPADAANNVNHSLRCHTSATDAFLFLSGKLFPIFQERPADVPADSVGGADKLVVVLIHKHLHVAVQIFDLRGHLHVLGEETLQPGASQLQTITCSSVLVS